MPKVSHFIFDMILISTFLSSTRKLGSFDFNIKNIQNKPIEQVIESYLAMGDWIVDTSINQIKKYPNLITKRKW